MMYVCWRYRQLDIYVTPQSSCQAETVHLFYGVQFMVYAGEEGRDKRRWYI